jgi:hypothetical protein
MFVLEVDPLTIAGLKDLPSTRGIESRVIPARTGVNPASIEIALMDSRFADVFDALIADVADAVAGTRDDGAAVAQLVGRLRRWQRFLEVSPSGLGVEAQRGLYGELWFLREHILDHLALGSGVGAWTGPRGAPQDFQLSGGVAVEVKATASKQPQQVRIANERQLDDTGIEVLILYYVSLDEREGGGESLPSAVELVRQRLAPEPATGDLFEERLLLSGYADVHSLKYVDRGYSVREARAFHVRDGFPRITERDLPNGVGDVQYAIDVLACRPYQMEDRFLAAALSRGSS